MIRFRHHRQVLTVLVAFSVLVARSDYARATDTVLIRAKHVITLEGKTLEPGAILIEAGKITAVAESIDAAGARVVEADWVMPGLVNAATSLGISGGSSEISSEVTPDFDTASAIDIHSRDFLEALDDGITTAHVLPGTQSVFSGYTCIVKTSGQGSNASEPFVLVPEHGLAIALCSDPTSRNQARNRPESIFMRQPTNRMGVMWILRSSFQKAQDNRLTPDLTAKTSPILQRALRGELPLFTVSRSQVDIESCFKLQDEFGLKSTIVGGDEAYRILDTLSKRKPTLIFTGLATGSSLRALRGPEGTERRWNVAGPLQTADIPFCLAGENLLDQMRFAVRFGLERQSALESVTIEPAKILKLDPQIGSIAVGKDADLIAFQGDPLEFTSPIVWTMVQGHERVTQTSR